MGDWSGWGVPPGEPPPSGPAGPAPAGWGASPAPWGAPPGQWGGAPGQWGAAPGPWQPPAPGADYGYGAPPPVADPGAARRRSALRLGLISLGLYFAAGLLAVAGLVTIFVGGVLLLLIAAATATTSVVLAFTSIFLALTARGQGAGARVAASIPAGVTLLIGGSLFSAIVPGTRIGVFGRRVSPRPVETALSRRPPELAFRDAARDLERGDLDGLCRQLDPRARPAGCEFTTKPCPEPCGTVSLVHVERETHGGTLVSYEIAFGGPGRHRARLVTSEDGWLLLDVPLVVDRCVDTAADPFGCPVHPPRTPLPSRR